MVGSARACLGIIVVPPISHPSAMPHCYLGYRVADESAPDSARLFLDETNRPLAPDEVLVLAVVEGFWYGRNGHALPEP